MSAAAPSFIRLLDSEGKKILDSVSTSYEDSFTLDTFEFSIQDHIAASSSSSSSLPSTDGTTTTTTATAPFAEPKSFIIARVQTWDHRQPDRAFYSYYNAFHLNKILFQTQVYLGKKLIHRLHVLNPLTNSDIVGNVLYFKVVDKNGAALASVAAAASSKNANANADPNASAIAASENKPTLLEVQLPTSTTGSGSSDHRRKLSLLSPFGSPGYKSPGIIAEEETGVLPTWTIAFGAVSETSEEEGNLNARKAFPNRKVSIGGVSASFFDRSRNLEAGIAPAQPQPGGMKKELRKRASSLSMPMKTAPMIITTEVNIREGQTKQGSGGGRHRSRTVSYRPHFKPSAGRLLLDDIKKTVVAPGTVTQFCVPVATSVLSTIAPPTPKVRRRTLSYANATSGRKASIQEWADLVRTEASAKNDPNEKTDYDVVPLFGGGISGGSGGLGGATSIGVGMDPLDTMTSPSDVSEAPTSARSQAHLLSPIVEPDTPALTSAYVDAVALDSFDAILIATDSDFLESSKIRAIFKANAVDPKDVELFQMPEVTGTEESEGGGGQGQPTAAQIVMQDEMLCDWCAPSSEEMRTAGPCLKLFHATKCYLVACIMLATIFFSLFISLRNTTRSI